MSILYVTDQGATITKTDGRVVVRRENKILEDLPAIDIERVVIFGNAHLTTPSMKFFLDRGIDVCLLSSRGRYKGRLQPEFCKDAELRRMQYKQSCNQQTSLLVSKSIVYGKLRNMESFLKRQKRQTLQVKQALQTIKRCLINLNRSANLDSVRGYEGSAASMYYKALSSLLKKEFQFTKRTHYPPADKTNILLSLGYTLLYNTIYGIINVVGFDPYQGFYHQTRHGHAALASDLMEEFRAIIVDSIVLLAINRGEIVPGNFSNQQGKIMFDNEGLKKFLNRYESRLSSIIRHPVQKIQLSYYQCMEAQVRHFARVIYGNEKTYIPFVNV
ncbi:MAG: CRISPR-associated endonuclease Cas1 [Candidatus Scalindua sp.]|nr:CRISPR-associated endonuclease Cas1 [Candidatus Scalindua sp.]MCR4344889.1 CRISPR-associated endonuclease Cas1 [Candidatus Scalindua sp.]